MATNGRPLRGIRNYHSKLVSVHTKCFIDSSNEPKNSADRRKKKLQTNRRSPTSDEFIHHICKYMAKNGVFILKFIDKWTSFTNTTHTFSIRVSSLCVL